MKQNGSSRKEPPHQESLRRHRVSQSGACYFITTNTRDRRPLLRKPACAQIVIDSLRWLAENGRIRLMGYVVMPDHLHFVMMLGSGFTLSGIMDSLKSYTARWINAQLRRRGALWQEQYHDHVVRTPRSYRAKLQYVHANPVRRGLVKNPDEYPFSTAHPQNQADIDWDALG